MASRPYSIDFGDEVITKQSFEPECNINNIMAKYQMTGLVDHVQKYRPEYADVTSLDYKTAMDTIAEARSLFEELPSETRKNFDNDVERWLDYVQDPANEDTLDSLEAGEVPEDPGSVEPAQDASAEGDECPPDSRGAG